MSMKFNQGGFNPATSSIGAQINDKFWSKVAVMEARKKRVFSQLGEKLVQPKNYGDKIVKYHELPIIHKLNVNDQGIDANGVSLVLLKMVCIHWILSFYHCNHKPFVDFL